MQNKPNPQNTKTSLTPCLKKTYKDYRLPGTRKNKPNSNPIPNTPSAPRCSLPSPRPRKSAFGTLPSGLCLLRAKTPKNHNLIMQNKPNSKNPKPNLTPYPKKNYAKNSSLTPQKNKPNSNPIPTQSPHPNQENKPNSNPIQTQFKPNPFPPKAPTSPNHPHPKSYPIPPPRTFFLGLPTREIHLPIIRSNHN